MQELGSGLPARFCALQLYPPISCHAATGDILLLWAVGEGVQKKKLQEATQQTQSGDRLDAWLPDSCCASHSFSAQQQQQWIRTSPESSWQTSSSHLPAGEQLRGSRSGSCSSSTRNKDTKRAAGSSNSTGPPVSACYWIFFASCHFHNVLSPLKYTLRIPSGQLAHPASLTPPPPLSTHPYVTLHPPPLKTGLHTPAADARQLRKPWKLVQWQRVSQFRCVQHAEVAFCPASTCMPWLDVPLLLLLLCCSVSWVCCVSCVCR